MSDTIGESLNSTSETESGRYLYCLVDLEGSSVGQSAQLDVKGIENESVSVVPADESSTGAVVHPRTDPYESTDLTALRDWLLSHQRVVEAAGDRFGTPLPVRFDTVLHGDDEAVTAWLARNADGIAAAFASVADRWEYRATLSWDTATFETEQCTSDPEVADIDRRLETSNDGKSFLLEKQRDQRLRELVRKRRDELTATFVRRLEEVSDRVTERSVSSEAAASLGVELTADAVAQVALLAPREQESTIGSVLDEIAESPGVDVRFTGPWPPYTFTPTIGEE